MRWLATLAVSAGLVTAGPASAAGTADAGIDLTQQATQLLAPPAHEAKTTSLYTARAGLTARSTGEWSAAPVVPQTTAVKKKTTVTKPAVKKTAAKPQVKTSAKASTKASPKNVTKSSPTLNAGRPGGAVAAPAGGRVNTVVNFALAQVGKPYRWGAAGPGAYDCSGLTMAAYAKVGIRLAHQSGSQASAGRAVSRAQLQRGDLIVYSGHVAIALGGGKMVHAANPRTGIVVANIYGSPIGYRRLL